MIIMNLWFVVSVHQIKHEIQKTAIEHDINPVLALAIAKVESGFNRHKIGDVGEVGVFQLRPEFHKVKIGDTRHNIKVAIKYMVYVKKRCYNRYGEAWFICYNTGPNRKHIIKKPREFKYYKKVVEAIYGE